VPVVSGWSFDYTALVVVAKLGVYYGVEGSSVLRDGLTLPGMAVAMRPGKVTAGHRKGSEGLKPKKPGP